MAWFRSKTVPPVPISDVYDLLGRFGCYIVGEQIVPVVHCLLALPAANMDTITDVYTHEQGFRQCGPSCPVIPNGSA